MKHFAPDLDVSELTTVEHAQVFATIAHRHQVRKYTGEPYFVHLFEVAKLYTYYFPHDDIGQAIAWLHDTIEDTDMTESRLVDNFGREITEGVIMLSDLDLGNRAARKALTCLRLSTVCARLQNIKVCDIYSNLKSIAKRDHRFIPVFLKEVKELTKVMTKTDPRLRMKLEQAFDEVEEEILQRALASQ